MFNANRLKLVFAILGIAAIVLAIMVYNAEVGSYEGDEYYGGDAYTGIQQAAAQAANNTMYVGRMLRTGLSAILALHGLVLLGAAVCIRKSETAVKPESPVQLASSNEKPLESEITKA